MTTLKSISENLKSRIHSMMEDANFMEITSTDWKAIGHNLVNSNSENDITDEMISEEIEFYYNS
jgi:intein-encoded DNA endonuclease-like protein